MEPQVTETTTRRATPVVILLVAVTAAVALLAVTMGREITAHRVTAVHHPTQNTLRHGRPEPLVWEARVWGPPVYRRAAMEQLHGLTGHRESPGQRHAAVLYPRDPDRWMKTGDG